MADKPRTRRRNRRADIITASAALFDKVGYHGASMQMLADAVNLGKPTLYHYFRSKSEILQAIHQDLIVSLLGSHGAREAQGLPPDVLLKGICFDILSFIKEHPGYVRAFIEHYDELDDKQKKEARKQRAHYLKITTDIIAQGTKQGVFVKCNPRLAALGFLGMCNWTYKWFPGEKRLNVKKTADELSQLFLQGLYKN